MSSKERRKIIIPQYGIREKNFIDKWFELDHKWVRTIRDITEDSDTDEDTTTEDGDDS